MGCVNVSRQSDVQLSPIMLKLFYSSTSRQTGMCMCWEREIKGVVHEHRYYFSESLVNKLQTFPLILNRVG